MSIDLNKKYAITGSQLTKLKTYIDNSGGGGGSEILYGADEPEDSIGTDGQLYVMIPELVEDDYGNFTLKYQYPTGYKAELQLQTSFSAASQALYPDGTRVFYPQGSYFIKTSWEMEESVEVYSSPTDVCSSLTQMMHNWGIDGSITYDTTTGIYTITGNGETWTASTWDEVISILENNLSFWEASQYSYVGDNKYMCIKYWLEDWGGGDIHKRYEGYTAHNTLGDMAQTYGFQYSDNPEGIYAPTKVPTDTQIHTETFTTGESLQARLATIKSETILSTPLNLEIIKQ